MPTLGNSADPSVFFRTYGFLGKPIANDVIVWSSGYGAKFKRHVNLGPIANSIIAAMKPAATPENERLALRNVLAQIECHAQTVLKMSDRAGLDFSGSNDPTQMDCVDEAWNATVACMWLKANGLLRMHTVREPISKWSFFKWNHYGAVIRSDRIGVDYVIDGGVRPGGHPPLIIEKNRWYL